MALTETEKKAEKKEKPLTKVIIRRLPPTMTREQFLDQVSPLPDYNYIYHVTGDMSLGENAFSRAYINFVCPEDVYIFKEKFDNYTFVDSRGHEYPAVVEFSPFQKIPKRRGKNKMDPKNNTIEQDTYYLEFVANLNKPVEQDAKPEYTLQLGERDEDKKKDMSTPLLEYIKNRRAQKQRIREVRREERERRKKEYEKKKEEYKKFEEKPKFKKPLIDTSEEKSSKDNVDTTKPRKPEEKKERKEIKPRFPKKESYPKKPDPKKIDEPKKDDGKKKVKKYSERREERKLEAKKAELKKQELAQKDETVMDKDNEVTEEKASISIKKQTSFEKKDKARSDSGSSSSRRIRNKDRPALAIYRPGMLRKKTNDGGEEQEEKKVEAELD